jgi:hypothetical protein
MKLPKTIRRTHNRRYADVASLDQSHSNDYDTTNTLPTNSTTSTITTLSNNNKIPTVHDNTYQHFPAAVPGIFQTILHEIQLIHDNLSSLTTIVGDNKSQHQNEMEQMENRFNTKLQVTCDDQQKQLLEISQTYIQKIQTEQKSNNSLLRTMLAEQENSIEQKLQENFQEMLTKLNTNSASPTRKKPSTSTIPGTNPITDLQDTHMPDTLDHAPTNSNITLIPNPYHK